MPNLKPDLLQRLSL